MILDTNAVSDIFAGDEALGRVLSVNNRHHLPIIVIGEYCFGLFGSTQQDALQPLLERLEGDSFILYPDRETARHYARIRHELRQAGKPIPENDVWIAALARQHQLAVVTRDTHYDHVDGLHRIAW